MGLMKIAIIIGGVVIGAGAIGGIAAGVVASRQVETGEQTGPIEPPKRPDTKPMEPTGGMQGDEPDASIPVTVDTVISQLKQDNVGLYYSNAKKERTDFYAFNVKAENLKLELPQQLATTFKVELSLDTKQNTVDKLNDGILVVTAKVSETNKPDSSKETPLTLTGFKKGDEILSNIFDEVKEQQTSKYSLTITPKTDSKDKFVSIEDLNKPEGLANWLKESTLADIKAKGVKVEGEVKLETFTNVENKTYFVLGQKSSEQYIKLVKEEDSNKKEALVESIKTTNLLATDITVIPVNVDTNKTETYIGELKAIEENSNGYKKEEKADSKLNRDLSINPNPSNSPEAKLYLKPYLISKPLMMNENKIDVQLTISFGNDNKAKQFSTTNKDDLKLLKDAGFSFNVYGKRISEKTKNITSDKVKETNSLETFFKEDNYKTPMMKMNGKDMNPKKVAGDFYVNTVTLNEKSKVIEVKFGDGSQGANDLAMKNKTEEQNFLLFADYSYKTANETDSLINKVLLTPSISLVHLEKISEGQK